MESFGRPGHQFISSVPTRIVLELECVEGVSWAPHFHLSDNMDFYWATSRGLGFLHRNFIESSGQPGSVFLVVPISNTGKLRLRGGRILAQCHSA